MNYKYIILDFGNVIAMSSTGNWNITPKFLELIDISKLDMIKLKKIRDKYKNILSEKIVTLEEEYDMFKRFYDSILSDIDYPNHKQISEQIAYDRTYNFNKYKLFDNIYEELNNLKEKYKLILLTDNWVSVIPYLKEYKLYDYFEKIYVSSIYGIEKNNKMFFDYPIKDFDIKYGEALFIDDNELNLDNAKEKGLDVLLMDRKNKINNSKYRIINNLKNI